MVKIIDFCHIKTVSPCKCSECGKMIPYGEKQRRATYRWDGIEKLDIYRRCEDCESLAYLIRCFTMRNLHDDIVDGIKNDHSFSVDLVDGLTPSAREWYLTVVDKHCVKSGI